MNVAAGPGLGSVVAATSGQGRQYREQGYFTATTGLPESEVAALRRLVDRTAEEALGHPESDPRCPPLTHHRPEIGYLYDMAHKEPLFEALVKSGPLVDLVAPLLEPNISLFTCKVVFKPRGFQHPVPWHQDYPKWVNLPPKVMIWLALDDVDVDNGCVHIFPASHKDGIREHTASPVKFYSWQLEGLDESKAIPVRLSAGQCLVFHSHIIHGSPVPTSDRPRRGVVIGYQGGENVKAANGWPIIIRQGAGTSDPINVQARRED